MLQIPIYSSLMNLWGEKDLAPRSPTVSPLLGPETGISDHAGPSPHEVRVYVRYAVAIPLSATILTALLRQRLLILP